MVGGHNICLGEEILRKLNRIRHIALDMDGTVYLGDSLFPFTEGFLRNMEETGIRCSFLTNNPTKSVNDYIDKLERMGICACEDSIYTSSVATIDYIRSHYPQAEKLFILGTPSMVEQFGQAGFRSCADSPDDVPDVLVVAFDTTLTHSRLCRAAWWAAMKNIPYIATNPDLVCPTDMRTILVDCGSVVKCIESATGRKPDVVLGKPDPNMLFGIMDKYGYERDEVAMVGDRIYTDVATAHNAGAFGVLVLSGETTAETVRALESAAASDVSDVSDVSAAECGAVRKGTGENVILPDLTVRDLAELGEWIMFARSRADL